METLFQILYYGFSLKVTGILLGVALILIHSGMLAKANAGMAWLQDFPRAKQVGIGILFIDLVWSFIVITKMDMGEFHATRAWIQLLLPVGFVLIIRFVDEFLAVRALGALLLLMACPVLKSAWLEDPASRVLLPALAYVWIVAGLFWVGMPYLLRDQIDWITRTAKRWKTANAAGLVYGVAVLACAALFY